jgi:hypothetical protein
MIPPTETLHLPQFDDPTGRKVSGYSLREFVNRGFYIGDYINSNGDYSFNIKDAIEFTRDDGKKKIIKQVYFDSDEIIKYFNTMKEIKIINAIYNGATHKCIFMQRLLDDSKTKVFIAKYNISFVNSYNQIIADIKKFQQIEESVLKEFYNNSVRIEWGYK